MSVNKMINGDLVTFADRVQYSTMPNAAANILGKIVEYTGATTGYYTHGYYYECIATLEDDVLVYSWRAISVQDSEKIQVEELPATSIDELGKIYQYIGATTSTLTNGYFYECIEIPDSSPTEYAWQRKPVMKEVQVDTLPAASESEWLNIYQYTGTTDYGAGLINGHFYKCVEVEDSDPVEYTWTNVPVQPVGADTIVDVNAVPVTEIENVIYRTTDAVSGETSYFAGNAAEVETEQLAKYEDIQFIQVDTMPTADSTTEGRVVEYIGVTTSVAPIYKHGFFYECVSDGASTPTYSWEEVDFGDGTPHWSGTRAEYEAIKDTLAVGTIVNITDDYDEGLEVVDVVEEDNMNPVTSNAVYDAITDLTPVDAITNGNMNPVTSNAVAKMCKHISVGSLPDKVIPTTGTVITQLTLPKGKWMVLGQLHTNGFSTANQLLTLSISVNGSAAAGETVDQKVQVPGYWVFVHGMLYLEPTTEVTVKLVAVATEQITGVVKAEMIAIPVAD